MVVGLYCPDSDFARFAPVRGQTSGLDLEVLISPMGGEFVISPAHRMQDWMISVLMPSPATPSRKLSPLALVVRAQRHLSSLRRLWNLFAFLISVFLRFFPLSIIFRSLRYTATKVQPESKTLQSKDGHFNGVDGITDSKYYPGPDSLTFDLPRESPRVLVLVQSERRSAEDQLALYVGGKRKIPIAKRHAGERRDLWLLEIDKKAWEWQLRIEAVP